MAAGSALPSRGTVFFSVADRDKAQGLEVAKLFVQLGFDLAATFGTAGFLRSNGIEVAHLVAKIGEEKMATDAISLINSGGIQLVINTPRGFGPRADGIHIRTAALVNGVPCLTTLAAARAAALGIAAAKDAPLVVRSLQSLNGTSA